MKIELIKAPTDAFVEMMLINLRSPDRKRLEGMHWGAVGLVQANLIDLYWAADLAEKASKVKTALVFGSCPQHIQMLAIFGNQAEVAAALRTIKAADRK